MAENARCGEEGTAITSGGKKKTDRSAVGRGNRDQKVVRVKERYEEQDLPSPPPDPWSLQKSLPPRSQREKSVGSPQTRSPGDEVDIIAYLERLGRGGCESRMSDCPSRNSTVGVANEEVFEHLDRLYGLAEQILELRGRSTRLFKRVRDLERLKALRNADREAERAVYNDEEPRSDFPDEDAGFAESLLDAMLSNGRDPQSPKRNGRPPPHRRRTRSLGLPEQFSLPGVVAQRSEEEKRPLRTENTAPKVSKWTRVKAAFRWERACPSDVAEFTETATVTTPTTPTNRFLRIPEVAGSWSGSTLSPAVSEASGPSTPIGRVSSTSSSNEDVRDANRRNAQNQALSAQRKTMRKKDDANRRSRSLDGDLLVTNHQDVDDPTANEMNSGKPQIRIISENPSASVEQSLLPKVAINARFDKNAEVNSKRPTPTLTITIPSNDDDFRSASSPESISPFPSSTQDSGECSPLRGKPRTISAAREFKRQRSVAEEAAAPRPKMQRQDSKWNKVRRAFLTNAAFSVPPSPVRVIARQSFGQDGRGTPKAHSCNGSVEDLGKLSSTLHYNADTMRDYQALREKLGTEFHRKLIEWEQLKGTNRTAHRGARDTSSSREGLLCEERLAPEFKRKLQEWKRAKKGRRGSATIEQQRVSRRRLTDWQLWRSPAKPETRSHEAGPRGSCGSVGSAGSAGSDGKPHPCEDFVRRMEAWRRVNDTAAKNPPIVKEPSPARQIQSQSLIDESEFLVLDKVIPLVTSYIGETDRRGTDAPRIDDFLSSDDRSEVLIQTSVGSYRFEGISREFTRKLYDWERYRGISPRSSTFRLLDPRYAAFAGATNDETEISPTIIAGEEETYLGGLKRSKSLGSIVPTNERKETFIRRPTSLQSLSRLCNKLEDLDHVGTSPAPIGASRVDDVCDDAAMDDSEPEAMIVDIEDVIEETASPLARVQPHQTPVYSVAASETTSIAVPLGTVTSSHEPSPVILVEAEENSTRQVRERSRDWHPETDCSSQDEESVHSDHSPHTNCLNRISRDYDAPNIVNISNENEVFVEASTTTSKKESSGHSMKKTEPTDNGDDGSVNFPRGMDKSDKGFNVEKSTDLPIEHEEWTAYLEDGQSGNSVKDPAVDIDDQETSRDRSLGETSGPEAIQKFHYLEMVKQAQSACDATWMTIENLPIEVDSASGTEVARETLCSVNEETQDIDGKYYEDFDDRRRDLPAQKETSKMMRGISACGLEERLAYDNAKGHPTANPPVGTHQFHSEATVRTTPLTVSTCREARCVERIIITEETLNKIVVPTACSKTSMTKLERSDNRAGNNAPGEDNCACNHRYDRGDRKDDESPDDRGNVKPEHDEPNKSIAERKLWTMQEQPTSISTCSSSSSSSLSSRNVFVKTKRMIFSPFRPRKENIADREGRYCRRERSRSKSRSVSPRVSRQDAFQRMQLPLLWPLGLNIKDRECPEDATKGPAEEGVAGTINTASTSQPNTPDRKDHHGNRTYDDVSQSTGSLDAKPPLVSTSTKPPTIHLDAGRQVNKDIASLDDYAIDEKLSSDLAHKLKILSNVAARRTSIDIQGESPSSASKDEKPSTSSTNTQPESRAARIRRTREDFLAGRTYSPYQSSFASPSENQTLTEDPRKSSFESTNVHPDITRHVTLQNDSATVAGDGWKSAEGTSESYQSADTSSRPDLIKSASAGMINVDADTFGRLATSDQRGCESLPRATTKRKESAGPLARIVNRLGLTRLIRGKDDAEDRDDDRRMSTISTLCRQSLLIDVRPDLEERRRSENQQEEEEDESTNDK